MLLRTAGLRRSIASWSRESRNSTSSPRRFADLSPAFCFPADHGRPYRGAQVKRPGANPLRLWCETAAGSVTARRPTDRVSLRSTDALTCAMTLHVDFTSDAFFRDPAAAIERIREVGPVLRTRFPLVGKVWITTTYETTARVLKDSTTFTLRRDGDLAGMRWWMPKSITALASNMLTMDEPDHTRLRGIVDEAFRRRAVLDLQPRIRAIADGLAGALFAQGSPADLVTRYARMLPLSVICELLGLPLADRAKFIAWAGRATGVRSTLGFFRLVPTITAMRRYLEKHLERARNGGGDGLIGELVRVEKEGARLTRDEMVAMVFLLLL